MSDPTQHVRVAVVGSGFGGLGTAVNLKRAGIDDFVILERAGDLGGTWRDNTYPGCQCDVPSTLYSFSFAPHPDWTRTFPLQSEIWDYLRHVVDRFALSSHIRYRHEVTAATWDEPQGLWRVETTGGPFTAQILVLAPGALSEPANAPLPGLERFEGKVFHSAAWDHEHDLSGERVAVIGTGASSIQFVPRIQPQVAALQLYQRTAPWVMPHPDRAVRGWETALWRAFPRAQHLWRAGVWSAREALVLGLSMEPRLMSAVERVAKTHLRAQVRDPALRAKLLPAFRLGCKRILISNEYYPALAAPNVELITSDIAAVEPHSIVDVDGIRRDVDTIICATGFRVSAPPWAARIRGRGGELLADVWHPSRSAYLGTTVAGFPNVFMITGPNTGLGHSSMIYMIESQIAYVVAALTALDRLGVQSADVRPEVQDAYNQELQRRLAGTVWNTGGCRSWYLDQTGRNTALWPSFTFRFRARTRRFNPADYLLRGA
ncbi:MAG: NAD(P)/FAD-dependent oxidoreductase [Actinomycetota bacterium]|nr:NAD(P)/FAD-dependent oxidoreductase [Actinomycetota bacterium]